MRYLSLPLLACLLAACGSEANDTHVVVGNIDVPTGMELVRGPDVLSAGQAADMVVNTFGSSCIIPDHVALKHLEPLLYEVTPFDRVPDGGPCPADFGERPHPITLVYPQTGTGVLRIIGMRFDEKLQTMRLDTVEVAFRVMGRA